MVASGARRVLVGSVVLLVTLGSPAVALALSGNRLTITAPSRPRVGKQFSYRVTGHSTAGHRGLVTFLNTRLRCPRTLNGELRTPYANTSVASPVHRGRILARYLVKPHTTGRHYICAYLYEYGTGRTLAHAGHRYITRPRTLNRFG